jgi:FHA domain
MGPSGLLARFREAYGVSASLDTLGRTTSQLLVDIPGLIPRETNRHTPEGVHRPQTNGNSARESTAPPMSENSQMDKFCFKSFMESCGATGPLNLSVEHRIDRDVTRRLLSQPFAVVGSGGNMDVILNHQDVSGRQAYLQVIDGRIFGVDLSRPAASTRRDDGLVAERLGAERPMAIGPFDVTPSLGESPDNPSDTEPLTVGNPLSCKYVGREALPEAILVFQDKAKKELTWPLTRVLTLVGRSSACKVQLKASDISAFHCSVVRTPSGVWVVDLLGRGGISINGVSVRFARLDEGDLVRVGEFLIGLRPAAPASIGLTDQRGHRPMLESPAPTLRNGHRSAISDVPGIPTVVSAKRLDTTPQSAPAKAPAPNRLSDDQLDRLPPMRWTPEVLGPVDPASATLFEQFGSMQKQMFEQFEQFVTMMCQTMGALHQDQMVLVRNELAQIRRLTQELSALKDEQSTFASSAPNPSVPGMLGLAPKEAAALLNNDSSGAHEPQQSRANGRGHSEEWLAAAAESSQADQTGSSELGNEARSREAKRAIDAQGEPRSDPSPFSQTSEEIHILLTRRIAAIQQEQRGRLHRLFGLVTRR